MRFNKQQIKNHIQNNIMNIQKRNQYIFDKIEKQLIESFKTIEEKEQQYFVILLCSNLIAGFETKKEKIFIIEGISNIIRNL